MLAFITTFSNIKKKVLNNFSSLVTEIYTNIPKALRPKPKERKKENTEKQVATAGAAAQSMQSV